MQVADALKLQKDYHELVEKLNDRMVAKSSLSAAEKNGAGIDYIAQASSNDPRLIATIVYGWSGDPDHTSVEVTQEDLDSIQ